MGNALGFGASLLIVTLVLDAEQAWLGTLIVLGVWLHFRVVSRLWSWALPGVCLGLAAAHLLGFKAYGTPKVIDNRPVFRRPQTIIGLEPPNLVRTDGGGLIIATDVTFSDDLRQYSGPELAKLLTVESGIIHCEADPHTPSGIALPQLVRYWCGNTFDRASFPPRLPRYQRVDLGEVLASQGLATIHPQPTASRR